MSFATIVILPCFRMTSISKLYEPSPRYLHGAASVGGRCYLWGGRVQDFSESCRRKLTSTVEIFDPYLETWEEHPTTGMPHPGLYAGACTSLFNSLYWFGGGDGSSYYNSLHRLDPTTLEWRELQHLNHQADGPMRKAGCGMVSFHQDKLAVFGGYGFPTGPTQPGAMFTKKTIFTDGRGWSNELHMFNIIEGMSAYLFVSNLCLLCSGGCHNILASFPGHSQILSRSHGEKSSLHSCEIKSGSALGARLIMYYWKVIGDLVRFRKHFIKCFSHGFEVFKYCY